MPQNGMPSLVIRRDAFLFLSNNAAFALGPHHHSLDAFIEVSHSHTAAVAPGRQNSRFIDKVLNIRSRKSRGALGNRMQIYIHTNGFATGMHTQDLFAALYIWPIQHHPSVKATRTQ